ncbi:MAG: SprT-like domain-containing protein, partial [Chthoniobacterales bacterium]
MLWLEQLELRFLPAQSSPACGRDAQLEKEARRLLLALGGRALARSLRVTWSSRLRSAAGRADFRHKVVSLNPRLKEHGAAEIDRTLRHELAHLLAHFRFGRRRVRPHGAEWQRACADLGIAGESRCHALPFPVTERTRHYLYG